MSALAACRISIEDLRPGTLLTVSGTLDESANLERYTIQAQPGIGSPAWTNAVNDLDAEGTYRQGSNGELVQQT